MALLLALGVAGCIAALRDSVGPPVFDHAGHMKRELACVDCHAGVAPPKQGADASARAPGMPPVSLCNECHGPRFDREETLRWIADWGAARERTPHPPTTTAFGPTYWDVTFAHGPHLAKGIACAECHAPAISPEIADATFALAPAPDRPYGGVPTMGLCQACHVREDARAGAVAASASNSSGHGGAARLNDCATCHVKLADPARGAPRNHEQAWELRHGLASRTPDRALVAEKCDMCHARSSCDQCHAQNPPRDHTNPFRTATHGLNAAMDRSRCLACHQADTCNRCHEVQPPRSHSPVFGAPRNGHCVSCHQPVASTGCITCHPGTPSHSLAPPKPPSVSAHRTTTDPAECLACHRQVSHPVTFDDCNQCHR